MAFPWGPVVSAGGQLLGGIVSAFGARGQDQASLMSAQRQESMQAFHDQLQFGPTWEMAGLKRAGINPMLRYGHGGSAVPTSAVSVSAPAPFNPLEGLAQGIAGAGTSAVSAYRDVAQGEATKASIPKLKIEAVRVATEIPRIMADTRLSDAQRTTEIERAAYVTQQAVLAAAQAQLPEAQMRVFAAQIANMGEQNFLLQWQQLTEQARRRLIDVQATTAAYQQGVISRQAELDMQIFDQALAGLAIRVTRMWRAALGGRD